MKNIISSLVLSVLLLSPVVTPLTASAATIDTQTTLLIQLLLEKVRMLQAELEILIKAKSDTVKVEIIGKDFEYKKEVAPILDLIEEKNKQKKTLQNKIDEKKCIRPFRFVSKGITTVNCRDTSLVFSATSTQFVIGSPYTVVELAKKFNLDQSQITILPVISDERGLISTAVAVIPASSEMITLTKQMKLLDDELSELNSKVQALKSRYGI